MIKRLMNNETYKVETEKAIYIVTLERIKNDINGNARYKANIITLLWKENNEDINKKDYFTTAAYTFTGHYLGSYGEAKEIARTHEERMKGDY